MVQQVYGDGINSTNRANIRTDWYDKAGIKAANEVNVYQQFSDKRSMPTKSGKTYKVSKWLHIYDRHPTTDPDFAARGYLSARDIDAVTLSNSNAVLTEGAGDINQVSIERINLETSLARYGNMIKYTDEVELFSDDYMQVRYREELAKLANRRMEDLIQLDMLSSPTRLFVDTATAVAEVGTGALADGSTDNDYKVSYNLVRKIVRAAVRNRAEKNTEIVTGSTKIDTKTVNRSYYTIIGSDVKYDLEMSTRGAGSVEEFTYIPRNKYASATNLAEGEVGAMHDLRFIESESQVVYAGKGAKVPQNYIGELQSSGGTDNTSADVNLRDNFDVHPIIVPTQGSFATVGLKGNSKIKFTSKSPAKIEEPNPYGTKGFFAYNFFYASLILREERLLLGFVCASK